MTDELDKLIRKAAEVLKAHGAREVYVFGSAAEGRLRDDSDVDLAVTGLPPRVFFRAAAEAWDAMGRPVDLLDLDKDTPVIRQLKEAGVLQRVG